MKLYNWRTAPIEQIVLAGVLTPPRKNRGGNKRRYQNIVCAFDIETSKLDDDHSVMYIWQFQIGMIGTVTGRSWKEFKNLIARIKEALDPGVYLVVYVHNLAFEFQFLRGIYNFHAHEVFAVDERKPLRVDMEDCIEFRCSYLHSNMSLDEYLKKMGVQDLKQHGFDYEKPRYPWTPLTDDELLYCVNDVRGLVEAILAEMAHDKDTLYTIPATSTGYVRRDVRRIMTSYPWHYVHDMLPDRYIYDLLREAFRGGNTHANRYYAGQILDGVSGYDRSSSYPDVQCNCKFPVSPFIRVESKDCTPQNLYDLIMRRKKAVLVRVALSGVRLKDEMWGCPYLPVDKCRKLTWTQGKKRPANFQADNGRILRAEYLETTFTDIDWKIFCSEYDFADIRILDMAFARYGYLPKRLIEQIQVYYQLKTKLKGDDGHRMLYDKSKAKLNSIYGMSAQNPCRIPVLFDSGIWSRNTDTKLLHTEDEEVLLDENGRPKFEDLIDSLLNKYNRTAWFCYQWGVWTSAWARLRLEEGIRLAAAGADLPRDDPNWSDFVYCDTDSVKYLGHVDWSKYNDERRADSQRSGSYADDAKGKRHYMGVYEPEDGYPARFATRGAKKYVVEHADGTLDATISGVTKKLGAQELEEAGGISAFLTDFTFRKAGGTMLRYNDRDRYLTRIDGHRLMVRECVTITPDIYTLTDTEEYDLLLKKCRHIFSQFRIDIIGNI